MVNLTQLDANPFRGLLELFQLGQGRLDTLGQDGVHHEVLVEVALAGVAIALEHEEVAIVGDLTADRPVTGVIKLLCRDFRALA